MSGDNLKVSGGRGRHLCGNCGGLFFKFFRPSRRLDELLQGNCRQGCGGGGGRIKGVDGGTPLPDKRMAFLQTRRRQDLPTTSTGFYLGSRRLYKAFMKHTNNSNRSRF
jgi:hypothetical protein